VPLPEKPLAIVLGGTHPHVALIERLKARGYRILLADYLESPPAAAAADEHARVSTLAMDDVLALARARKAALVIATCVDRANLTAAYVAERLGLPAPYGFATARRIADKLEMKRRLQSLGVPTAEFAVLGDAGAARRCPLPFPVVVKPIDTGGSKGVRKATDPEQLLLAAEQAFEATRSAEVLVERFLEGVEVSADCLVQEGVPQLLLVRRKYVLSGAGGELLASYASVCPAALSPLADARIRKAAQDIARGFDLRSTPLLVQFIVNGDDVRVIEFAPRVGGGTNYRQVMLQSGVDIVEAAIDAYLGERTVCSVEPARGYTATSHVYAEPGLFGEIRHHEELLGEGVVAEFYIHKARGASIGPSTSASERVASFIVRGDDAADLLRRTRQAMQRLEVMDAGGRSILRRELYLKAL